MPLLAVLTQNVPCFAETTHFTICAHEPSPKQQLPAHSLTLFLQFRDKSLSFCAKAKQQYKERQLHNGSSDLPWTGTSFEPCNEYRTISFDFQEI
jgi:hypothetical protein